ncbi:MAG: alpha-L-fucosidase [Clostridia bacterium]
MKSYFNDSRDRFFDNRLGLFVHWGIYSVEAWHEQHGYRKNMKRNEYAMLAERFNPRKYNPAEWVDIAIASGMSYICFTSKHIDGFCMFDTKTTEFNIMNTPYGRDVLKELADECNRRDFPFAIYYSAIDRNHRNYPFYGHPYELKEPEEDDNPDLGEYVGFMKRQIMELCTNYGKIYEFWWDSGHVLDYKDDSINEMIRRLQPGVLINGRGFGEADFRTPERDWYEYVDSDESFSSPTEACQSVGTESWGYRKDEDYYSIRYLIESIDKILAKGGNYLLNAGPDADGAFPGEARKILESLGKWYSRTKEAFEGAEPAPGLTANKDVLLTKKNGCIYVHMYRFPKSSVVWLKPMKTAPSSAILLNNMKNIDALVETTPSTFDGDGPYLRLHNLPVDEFRGEVMVVRMEFSDKSE